LVEAPVAARLLRERGDPAGMAPYPGRFEVREVGERGEQRIERLRFDRGHRFGLSRQRCLPLIPSLEVGEDVSADPLEGVDDGRVVGATPPPAYPLASVLTEPGCEIGVPCDHDDTHGEWDRVALESRGPALPVPAFVGMGEGVDDRWPETDPFGEHGADL